MNFRKFHILLFIIKIKSGKIRQKKLVVSLQSSLLPIFTTGISTTTLRTARTADIIRAISKNN